MKRTLLGGLLGAALALGAIPAKADPVTITLARFFGACEGDYGSSTDVSKARGECGIITTLVNKFNADNQGAIVVKPQIIEWNPYYNTITARLVSHDVPTVAVMHMSQLGDFAARKLVQPLDAVFKDAGIDASDFTPAAKSGTEIGGHYYALPWDTHSWLWHYNVGLMKQAGLVDGSGAPVVPKSTEELLAQAKTFRAKTGKPLLLMAEPDAASAARTFYTYLGQQGAALFPHDFSHADFATPAAHKTVETIAAMYANSPHNEDYAAATASFPNGEAGIYMSGTWLIDSFSEDAAKSGSPLSQGYWVTAFPTLLGKPGVWADGHSWVLLRGAVTDANRPAVLKFMKFLYDNNYQWARTGHLPIRQSVISSTAFLDLPYRKNIAVISQDALILPHDVRRQFGIQTIISEEVDNVLTSGKSIDAALASAQSRTNTLLANTH